RQPLRPGALRGAMSSPRIRGGLGLTRPLTSSIVLLSPDRCRLCLLLLLEFGATFGVAIVWVGCYLVVSAPRRSPQAGTNHPGHRGKAHRETTMSTQRSPRQSTFLALSYFALCPLCLVGSFSPAHA